MLLIWPWHQPWQAGTRDMHTSAKGAQHRPNPSEVGGRESRRVPLRERESNPKRAIDKKSFYFASLFSFFLWARDWRALALT